METFYITYMSVGLILCIIGALTQSPENTYVDFYIFYLLIAPLIVFILLIYQCYKFLLFYLSLKWLK